MRIVTKITAGLLLLTAVGCREMPTVTVGGGRTLAKAGGATLDEQELDRALPAGLTGDDSVAFAELYVRKWIGKQLKQETIVDREALDHGEFGAQGGFKRLNKVFGGKLEDVLGDLRDELWKDSA